MQKINKIDMIAGVCGIVLSLLYFLVLIPFGIGEGAMSGLLANTLCSKADFVPKIWAGLMLICSIGILVESSFKRQPGENEKMSQGATEEGTSHPQLSVLLLVLLMFAYLGLFVTLGFCIATMTGLFATMWLFGYRKIRTIITTSLIITVVMYLVFTKLLYVRFPGILF